MNIDIEKYMEDFSQQVSAAVSAYMLENDAGDDVLLDLMDDLVGMASIAAITYAQVRALYETLRDTNPFTAGDTENDNSG